MSLHRLRCAIYTRKSTEDGLEQDFNSLEMKLVITDERQRPLVPDPHLIAAVAQGRYWFTQIRGGEVQSVRDLAENHGVNQGDVSRILPLGLLAPDIVEGSWPVASPSS